MGILDTLKSTLSETGQTIVDKTKDTTATLKLNMDNKDQEREIKQGFEQLGEALFTTQEQYCAEKFPELVTKIKTAQEKIRRNNEEIAKINTDPMPAAPAGYCTSCGKPLHAGAAFCTYCGASVQPVGQPESMEVHREQAAQEQENVAVSSENKD